MFIRRILNKRSNQVKVLLYRTSIWKTVEILFLCKFKCIFPHRSISSFWYKYTLLRDFFMWGMTTFKVPVTISCSLSLSGEWISWNWPGREVTNKSDVFFSSRGVHQLFQTMIIHDVYQHLSLRLTQRWTWFVKSDWPINISKVEVP